MIKQIIFKFSKDFKPTNLQIPFKMINSPVVFKIKVEVSGYHVAFSYPGRISPKYQKIGPKIFNWKKGMSERITHWTNNKREIV